MPVRLGDAGVGSRGLRLEPLLETGVGGDGSVDGRHQLISSRALVRRKPGMLINATIMKMMTETAAANP